MQPPICHENWCLTLVTLLPHFEPNSACRQLTANGVYNQPVYGAVHYEIHVTCCSIPWGELWSGDVRGVMSATAPRYIITRCLLRSHETWSMRPSRLRIRWLLRQRFKSDGYSVLRPENLQCTYSASVAGSCQPLSQRLQDVSRSTIWVRSR